MGNLTPEHLGVSQRAKRFYKTVSMAKTPKGWQVLLDGKPIRTPERHLLVLPAKALAEEIAREWDSQGEKVDLAGMRFTQFSCAALDYVAPFREDTLAETLGYAGTDLLCYRAGFPPALAEQQRAQWSPLVEWAQSRYGIVFHLAEGVMPVAQDEATVATLRKQLETLPLFALTALWQMTKLLGSLILALAVYESRLSADEAFALSRLDETFQNAHWGEDEEARARREDAAEEMAVLSRFLCDALQNA